MTTLRASRPQKATKRDHAVLLSRVRLQQRNPLMDSLGARMNHPEAFPHAVIQSGGSLADCPSSPPVLAARAHPHLHRHNTHLKSASENQTEEVTAHMDTKMVMLMMVMMTMMTMMMMRMMMMMMMTMMMMVIMMMMRTRMRPRYLQLHFLERRKTAAEEAASGRQGGRLSLLG